jgi:hypothetical protein
VGLIQRTIEAAGISTISVSLSMEITRKLRPPRAVFPGFPLGHPMGFPGKPIQHLRMLRLLLKFIETTDSAGALIPVDPRSLGGPEADGSAGRMGLVTSAVETNKRKISSCKVFSHLNV